MNKFIVVDNRDLTVVAITENAYRGEGNNLYTNEAVFGYGNFLDIVELEEQHIPEFVVPYKYKYEEGMFFENKNYKEPLEPEAEIRMLKEQLSFAGQQIVDLELRLMALEGGSI